MTPCKQLVQHDPANKQFGDCARAVVACMLDLQPQRVPHFAEASTDGYNEALYWERLNSFLDTLSLSWVGVPVTGSVPDVLATMEYNNPGVYYIMGCVSHTAKHYVVCCGDRIVCDPAFGGPYGAAHLRAQDDGLVWVHFLVHNSFTEKWRHRRVQGVKV